MPHHCPPALGCIAAGSVLQERGEHCSCLATTFALGHLLRSHGPRRRRTPILFACRDVQDPRDALFEEFLRCSGIGDKKAAEIVSRFASHIELQTGQAAYVRAAQAFFPQWMKAVKRTIEGRLRASLKEISMRFKLSTRCLDSTARTSKRPKFATPAGECLGSEL